MDQEQMMTRRLKEKGISRRDFMKYCTFLTATLGLSESFIPKVAEALTSKERPPVVWLPFAECTGCTEALLRTTDPWIDELVLDKLSINYQETIMAPSGEAAEKSLHDTLEKYAGKFVCIVDGSIPMAENGIYGMIGGKTMLDIAKEVCPKAAVILCVGTCSAFGGLPAAKPNPTGAKSIMAALEGVVDKEKIVNIPGCPPNPINMVGTIVKYLMDGGIKKEDLDDKRRPRFAYGETVHDQCERRAHYDNGEFAPSFESPEAKKGYCLYQLGCKGPETFNNCPKVKFNMKTSWPVQAGHPCIGCSEPDFWDNYSPFYKEL